MEDKSFDALIKKIVSDEVYTEASDWEIMRSRLVEEGMLDEVDSFDAFIKTELSESKATVDSQQWNEIHDRLTLSSYLRERLYQSKVAEVLVLFMLLGFLWNMVPVKHSLYHTPSYKAPIAKVAPILGIRQNEFVARKSSILSNRAEKSEQVVSNVGLIDFIETSFSEETQNVVYCENIQKITTLSPSIKHERDIIPKQAMAKVQPKRKMRRFVTLTYGQSYNTVSGGTLLVTSQAQGFGSQTSLLFGVNRGTYDLYSGFGFFNINYTTDNVHKVIKRVDGERITDSKISKAKYTYLYIPVGLKYRLHQNDRWNIFALANTNFNVLTNANYYLQTLTASEQKSYATSQAGSLRSTEDLSSHHFGLFQDGSVLNSFYISATVGLGMERLLDEHTVLFVQQSYTRELTHIGISPHRENIGSVQLELGLKFNF